MVVTCEGGEGLVVPLKCGDVLMTYWWSWRMPVKLGSSGWGLIARETVCLFVSLCGVNNEFLSILVALFMFVVLFVHHNLF